MSTIDHRQPTTAEPAAAPPEPPTDRRRLNVPAKDAISVAAVWLLLIAVTAAVRPDFLSRQSLLAITFAMSIGGILAVAQGLVVISGALLDLSIPVGLILSAFVTVQSLGADLPTVVAVAFGILAGALWGLLNGSIVTFLKLNPIIVMLATGFGGLAVMLIGFKSAQTPSKSELRQFGLGRFLGLPNVFWPMVAIVVLAGLGVMFTRWGRHVVAVGGNPAAAKTRGISLRRVRLGVFGGAGAIVGIAGVLFASVNPSFTPAAGSGFQLTVIAAVILAGVSLSGGKGNFLVLLLSVGFLSTISVSIAFFGLPPAFTLVFQGALLILAVGLDGYRLKRGSR